jgi:outer membrane protein TolC
MKRWLTNIRVQAWAGWLALVFAVGTLSGCGQPTFMSKEVFEAAHESLPWKKLEYDNSPVVAPLTDLTKAPATVSYPERKPYEMSLQLALAIALENGSPGFAPIPNNFQGQARYDLAGFNGGTMNGQSDRVRVLALNPALAGAAMEASLARFDAVWVTSMNWTNTDGLAGVGNFPGYLGSVPGQSAQFQSSIVKPFATGAVANVSWLVDYRNQNLNLSQPPAGIAPLINPLYGTRVSFGLEQPLWRDWGVEINDLLSRLPGITGNSLTSTSAQTGYNAHQGNITAISDRGPLEGILITRLRFDQNRAEFERNIHILMVNTEIAYWNLYNKYGQLYSYEENLRILRKAWEEAYHQWKGGRIGPEVYYQILGQFEEFRGNRIVAMKELLDAELNLRGFLGLQVEDGCRLVPITPPTMVQVKPDWDSCLHDALNLRPELILARDNIKYHQYLLQIQKNNIKPDLRAYARYEPFGEGSSLDGGGTFTDSTGTAQPSSAPRSLGTGHLADWQVGVFLNMPIGFRFEHAAIRTARLELAQAYYVMRDQEDKAARVLAAQYQDVDRWYVQIQANRAERESYQQSLITLNEKIKSGQITIAGTTAGATTVQVLQIQRSFAAALVKEYQSITNYNNAIAQLEWAKGTILRYNNVHISEGALPQCAEVRAVEYEKDRQRGLTILDNPDALQQPGRMVSSKVRDVLAIPISTMPADIVPAADTHAPGNNNVVLPPVIDIKPAPLPEMHEPRPVVPNAPPPAQPKNDNVPLLLPTSSTPPVSTSQPAPAAQPGVMSGIVTLEESVTPNFRPTAAAPVSPALNLGGMPANINSMTSPQPNRLPILLPTSPPLVGGP